MTFKKELSDRAVSLFNSGLNCAESLLLSTAESLHRCCPFIPAVATGFGAGFGRRGSVCGALTGGIMAVGLAYGRSKPSDDRDRPYGYARELYDRFQKEFGSVLCRELTDCDLTTPEGREKFDKQKIHQEKCVNYVSRCAEMVAEMVEAAAPERA
ncbi:MAG: C_GCAxxG_C_C family protein [Candidatus Eiseniibacteriota bacterium]|nr:MAG: C_GCAxxG_C_C family protein [Candidatus Eisenbacteria bacterium]